MSLRNYAELRKIDRRQQTSGPRLSLPASIAINHFIESNPLHIASTTSPRSSSALRPLLLVTGTQIQRNELPAPSIIGTVRGRPSTRAGRFSDRVIDDADVANRLHLPRLHDHSCSSEEAVCSSLASSVPEPNSSLSSLRRGSDDIVVVHDEISPPIRPDRLSFRKLDSTNTLEHLRSSFNVRNIAPKIKESWKIKPVVPIRRLSSFPELSSPRTEQIDDQQRCKISDQVSNLSSVSPKSLKEDETGSFIRNERCSKVEGIKSGDPHLPEKNDQCSNCSQPYSKCQEGCLQLKKTDSAQSCSKQRVLEPVPEDISSEVVVAEQLSKADDGSSQPDDSSEEMAAAAAKVAAKFHSVWPELLRSLVEQSLKDFENMDQHMKLCMADLLADDAELHPSN